MTSPGPELESIEVDSDGVVTNTWTDGTQSSAHIPSESVANRVRARSIATQQFFRPKRRRWPRPRV